MILSIGKPDLGAGSADRIHAAGYTAGLLIDKGSPLEKIRAKYDEVIEFDFDNLEDSMNSVDWNALRPAGLLCTYENYIPAKAALGEYLGLPSISKRSAALCTDKVLMRQAFAEYDTSITPEYEEIQSIENLLSFTDRVGFPVILKPAGLVKSLLVMRCDNERELIQNFSYISTAIGPLYEKYKIYQRRPKVIVEQFISGQMYSIAAFVDELGEPHFCDDAVTLTTAQQLNINDNYLYSRQLPSAIPGSLKNKLLSIATAGVKSLEMRSSPAHIELIDDGDAVKIIEIGARIGGYRPRMYDLSYGLDLIEAELSTALGHTPRVHGEFMAYTAVFEIFAQSEGRLAAISSLPNKDELYYCSIKIKEGQVTGPAHNGYKTPLVIIISKKNKSDFDSMCKKINNVRIEVD